MYNLIVPIGIIVGLLCLYVTYSVFFRKSSNIYDPIKSMEFDPNLRILTILDVDMLFDAAINSDWIVDILYEGGAYEQRLLTQKIKLNSIFDGLKPSSITAFNSASQTYKQIVMGKEELLDCKLTRTIKMNNTVYLEIIWAKELISLTGAKLLKSHCIDLFGSPRTVSYIDVGENSFVSCAAHPNLFLSITLDKGKVIDIKMQINPLQSVNDYRFSEQTNGFNSVNHNFSTINYDFNPNYNSNYNFNNMNYSPNYQMNNPFIKPVTSEKGIMSLNVLTQEIQAPQDYTMKLLFPNRVVIMQACSTFIDLNNLMSITLWDGNNVIDQINMPDYKIKFHNTNVFKICFEVDNLLYLYLPTDFILSDTEISTEAYIEECGNVIQCNLLRFPAETSKFSFIVEQYGQNYIIQVTRKHDEIISSIEPVISSPCGLINLSAKDNSLRIVQNNHIDVKTLKFRAIFSDASYSERLGNNIYDLVSIFPNKTLVAIYATANNTSGFQFDNSPLSCFEAIPGSYLIPNLHRDCFILNQNLYLESKGAEFSHASIKCDLRFATTNLSRVTVMQNNIHNITSGLQYYKVFIPEPKGNVIIGGKYDDTVIKIDVNLELINYLETSSED